MARSALRYKEKGNHTKIHFIKNKIEHFAALVENMEGKRKIPQHWNTAIDPMPFTNLCRMT